MGILHRIVGGFLGTPEGDLPEEVPPGVRVLRGRWIPVVGGRLSGMGRPAAAVTLGRTIVVHPEARLTARLLRHELEHTRQWAQRPLAFPFLYITRHAQYGYARNPYEVEARAAETRGREDARGGAAPTGQPGGSDGQP